MLFSEFWCETELCILFAETGQGKSILAVQIGHSISSGRSIEGFKMEAEPQTTLYLDFELTDKMFEKRYMSDTGEHYPFAPNFYRIELNPDYEMPEDVNMEVYLHQAIEAAIIQTNAKILIVDNLTYLSSETEKANVASPLMKHLKQLKNKYGLSILALAHTPKRSLTNPLTVNDLQGSKMLSNFCDTIFAIGASANDKNQRYLKQIKPRNTPLVYDSNHICLCRLNKETNFLKFEMQGFGREQELLKSEMEKEAIELEEQVMALHKQGLSLREIGTQLGISHCKAGRIVKDLG
jgi:RecA-family ATPase